MTPVRSAALLGLTLALCTASAPVLAQGEGVSKKEFAQAMATPDSYLRHNTILKINGDESKGIKLLLKILEGKASPYADWYDREAAIKGLARVANKKSIEAMVKKLKSKSYLVRQGICIALAKMNDDELYEHVFAALQDKDPRVRREAAHALRINRKKISIDALIKQWVEEEDPIVATFIRATLEDITRRYKGPDPLKWQVWWERVRDEFEVGSTDEEAERQAEEEGRKMKKGETRTRDASLTYSQRGVGSGPPILVIPPYGFAKEIITPFFTVLEQSSKIFYIDLPKIDSFQGVPEVAGRKYYPIDKLVGAFEKLREETKQERFVLMAWGMNSWVALRYALKYPKSVSHVVLVAPISSNTEYGRASERMIKQGKGKNDLELWHLGLTRSFNTQTGKNTHDQYHEDEGLAKPEGEGPGLDRKYWSLMFADPHDSLVALLYPVKDRILGSVAIPDYDAKTEPTIRPPMLCIAGDRSVFTDVGDVKFLAKHYGAKLSIYPGTSCMQHAEASVRFTKEVQKFIGVKKKKK